MRIQSRLTMVVKNEWRACQLQIPKLFKMFFNVVSRRTYNYLLKRILNIRIKYNKNFLWRNFEVLGLIDYNKLVFLNNWNKIKRVFFCSKNKRISIVLLERVFSKIYREIAKKRVISLFHPLPVVNLFSVKRPSFTF